MTGHHANVSDPGAAHMRALLGKIRFAAWRLELSTPSVRATTPMLRGVWGRALKASSGAAYREVFVGDGPPDLRIPRYVLRPAQPDPATAPAVEMILINVQPHAEAHVWAAWRLACEFGLGPNRIPFRIKRRVRIRSAGGAVDADYAGRTAGYGSQRSAADACRLVFPTPLRLLRKGVLLDCPTVVDIAAAGGRRVARLAGMTRGAAYRDVLQRVVGTAQAVSSGSWHGQRSSLVRWSGAQKRLLELYGVTGELLLPDGMGALQPLFDALRWLHLGKGTVYGMGQVLMFAL